MGRIGTEAEKRELACFPGGLHVDERLIQRRKCLRASLRLFLGNRVSGFPGAILDLANAVFTHEPLVRGVQAIHGFGKRGQPTVVAPEDFRDRLARRGEGALHQRLPQWLQVGASRQYEHGASHPQGRREGRERRRVLFINLPEERRVAANRRKRFAIEAHEPVGQERGAPVDENRPQESTVVRRGVVQNVRPPHVRGKRQRHELITVRWRLREVVRHDLERAAARITRRVRDPYDLLHHKHARQHGRESQRR
jgi:hypothetical protein